MCSTKGQKWFGTLNWLWFEFYIWFKPTAWKLFFFFFSFNQRRLSRSAFIYSDYSAETQTRRYVMWHVRAVPSARTHTSVCCVASAPPRPPPPRWGKQGWEMEQLCQATGKALAERKNNNKEKRFTQLIIICFNWKQIFRQKTFFKKKQMKH